jgi:hypothetical protein
MAACLRSMLIQRSSAALQAIASSDREPMSPTVHSDPPVVGQ